MKNENQNIEYKESWRDEYLQWVCGMANSIGGVIFIGKNDKGEVVGVDKAKKLSEDIPNKVRDTMGIIVNCLPHEQDGLEYLEITVPAMSYAVSYRSHFYYRSGATNLELTQGMLHTFLLGKNGMGWDDVPIPNVTIDDLDRDSFKVYRREALRHNRSTREELDAMTNGELLDKLHLRTENGMLKRAAILLFHEDPERWFTGAYIKVGRFTGSDLRYQDELHGSLMRQADQITDLVFTKYLIADIGYDNMTRVETYPYSKEAFREGIYNAIMHKAYETGNPIQIRIEDDKMYISNGLTFNWPWTPETLMASHQSLPPNKSIAHVFFRAGYVEAWGRGISKMCEACREWGQPAPEYVTDPGGLRLLFHALPVTKEMLITVGGQKSGQKTDVGGMRSTQKSTQKADVGGMKSTQKGTQKTDDGGTKSGPESGPESSPESSPESGPEIVARIENNNIVYGLLKGTTPANIYQHLKANPSITTRELSATMDISRSAILKHIETLKLRGFIERIGATKNGHWECYSLEDEKDNGKKGGRQ